MTRYALLALAGLAGCATYDPQPIIDSGRLYEYSTGLTPHRLAHCTALNAGLTQGPYASEVQALVRPDNYAVLVIRREWANQPFIVARVTPEATGSRLEVFMADLGRESDADWLARLRKGCDAVRTVNLQRPVEIIRPVPEAPPPPVRSRPTRG
jgi:hypothetical protein